MKVLIAPDKFKGSLTAGQVCAAVAEGLLLKHPHLRIMSAPLADGGEGTASLLTDCSGGKTIEVVVHGPLFESVTAHYGISGDGGTAFIEMAAASGLHLIPPSKRNPLFTTTLGTGELIRDALSRGVSNVVLAIGGSATNDAGMGMAAALGFDFVSETGESLEPVGKNLTRLASVDTRRVELRLAEVRFFVLCDVTNPLYGENGAAYVYGPQKGADREAVIWLDSGLQNFEKVIRRVFGRQVNFPGAGAAGGLGAGASVFLNAVAQKGIHYVMEVTRLSEKVRSADVVITGEGLLDNQSLSGKVAIEVARMAAAFGKPCIAICGQVAMDAVSVRKSGFTQVIPLMDGTMTEREAMENAYSLLKQKSSDALKLPTDGSQE